MLLLNATKLLFCRFRTFMAARSSGQASVRPTGRTRGSLLFEAARAGHAKTVRVLLALGADARSHGPLHRTALMAAAAQGHLTCVSILLPASDPAAFDSEKHDALIIAIDCGHIECVRLLLSYCDPEIRNFWGLSCMGRAIMSGFNFVELLAPACSTEHLCEIQIRGKNSMQLALELNAPDSALFIENQILRRMRAPIEAAAGSCADLPNRAPRRL